jgi:hypothetical protein
MKNKEHPEKAIRNQRRRLQSRSTHRMYSYGPIQRFMDSSQARATARTSSSDDLNDTPLVQRLCWTYSESANRLFTQTQVLNHSAIQRLEEKTYRLEDALRVVVGLEADIAGWSGPDLCARRGGEGHLAEEAILTRRQREGEASKAVVQSDLAQANTAVSDLRAACRADASSLTEQYELVCAAVRKLRAYTQRRGANYARAWDALRDDTDNRVEVPVPQWADGPCPWLPANFDRVLANTLTKSNSEGEQ